MGDRLQDRIVIVTGGGTGIGLAIARCCVEEGAAVMLAQRRVELAQREAEKLRTAGFRAQAMRCDVSCREDVETLIATTVQTFGKLDAMINNAALTGVAAELTPFLEETDEHWRRILDINLTGAFYCTQAAARQMIAQGTPGAIVNISSVAQYAAQEYAAPYCASKAGLDGLTKTAALELGPYRIRVNNIAPGDIFTEASADVKGAAADRGASGKFFRHTPLDRRGRPEEIGRVAAFLVSEEAGFVTGATWLVDGGFLSY
ncbi:MAG: SDR family oxidoreductase [candidate division Zixibacteria bacterium]|nr:SDR family oxidoreductase [candidate division Zixibacteria bacterium]